MDIISMLKNPLIAKQIMKQSTKITKPIEKLLDRIILQESEKYASVIILKRNNILALYLITTDEYLNRNRVLAVIPVSDLLENPMILSEIETKLLIDKVLKEKTDE